MVQSRKAIAPWGCNYKYGKQTKTERGTSIQWKGDCALSYNDAKTATHKHSFNSSTINGRAKGSKSTCRHADEERRKKHLKLSTMPCTILFYENYKK